MRKNNMKTIEEKEMIVKRYLNGESPTKLSDKFEINKGRIYLWTKKYQENGIEGLKSNTGKNGSTAKNMGLYLRKPKNKIQELEIELMEKQSEKDIARRLDVSVSKVDRKLNDISSHTILRHPTLPKSMNWDEFKATKDTKEKIAFIITDNDSGNIFDINNSRKSNDLEKYFRRYSRYERNKVKHISADFYSGYIYLAKKLFRNANISIDRFHIVS